MTALYAFFIIVLIMALGNMLAVKTNSVISMLFSGSVIFLVLFLTGVLPRSIFADSTMLAVGAMLIPLLLVHIGTMMNVKQLIQQWKTVLIALAAIVGIVIFVVLIGQYVVGIETALVAAPPIAGGVIAGIQMGEAAASIGREDLQVLASLLVVVQGFVGYPVLSYAMRKEANVVLEDYRSGTIQLAKVETTSNTEKTRGRFELPEKLNSSEWYLAKVAAVAVVAMLISRWAQSIAGYNVLDTNVLSLIFGVIVAELGLLEREPLTKANSYGFAMVALTVVIFNGLTGATVDILINLAWPIIITLALGTVGIVIFSGIVGKFLKVSPWMSIGIGITALIGFPGTFIIPGEVASALAKTPDEKEIILQRTRPQVLVAGFVTVSIASVVLAGFLAPVLAGLN
ncbi:hypothetical protein [Fundicoccus culcitae]|uniref:Na+/glutamate symporter n=1 Tax=Fundicoccus culcitae TaxID=2969821 RepID=A0ABY5P4V7_9LACT|nr:hypothetical protein [Fundicoccus culcitae]UUX33741.1 hypothetical protein NRE15_12750 [Fundicoccus culcitae]